MAETDILNPQQGFWPTLGDAPTWNYDYSRKKSPNSQQQQARMGSPYSRDIANGGRVFTLNWLNRPRATMDRLEQFYENFKDGYFTIIDYDNDSRHHVGRFADSPSVKQSANFTFTAQGVAFVECPRARMLVYPSDFSRYGHPINVVDDFLRPGATRVAAMVGTWVAQPAPAATSATDPTQFEMFDAASVVGDWAQVQYVGWGFQLVFRTAATLGLVNIYFDGTLLVTNLDLSNGAALTVGVVTAPATVTLNAGATPTITVAATSVSLDMHRVKVYAAGVGSAGAGAVGIIFPQLEYIY